MTLISEGDSIPGTWLRPRSLAEVWLVGRLGAAERIERGLPALPEHVPLPGLELDYREREWVSFGPVTALIRDDFDADVACFVHGRSLQEVATALARG